MSFINAEIIYQRNSFTTNLSRKLRTVGLAIVVIEHPTVVLVGEARNASILMRIIICRNIPMGSNIIRRTVRYLFVLSSRPHNR